MKALQTKYDVAVIGGGIGGMATAMRLQAKGLSTIVLESHGQPGGCAGYFRKKGFAFDVGATTLVDFDDNGVGGEFFKSVGLKLPDSDLLDYKLWLPDRELCLYHDEKQWQKERLLKLGNTKGHQNFWKFIDNLAKIFWEASRKGIKLPLQNFSDIVNAVKAIGLKNLYFAKYINTTLYEALAKFNLQNDIALKVVLSMLIEDTVHATLDKAPLINASLGITIRGAGLRRAKGGMKGLWEHLVQHYKNSGGTLKVGHKVFSFSRTPEGFTINTSKGIIYSRKLVSAVPAELTQKLTSGIINERLKKYVERDKKSLGSAIVVFLGVPESEVEHHSITHHQLLYDYGLPLGNGNNMFISVSAPGDIKSAPAGYRAVMLSTHCNAEDWKGLSKDEYEIKKKELGDKLVSLARRVYPELGKSAVIFEVGTPRTYLKYTGRPDGAVGGVRQTFENANFNALPHDIGVRDFRLAGDSTWPGLGTVACILGSRIAAKQILEEIID